MQRVPTRLLFHEDVLAQTFEARVVAHSEWSGQPAVLLDQTAFYPESGGQMADHGTLGGVSIRDVQIDERGEVHHVVGGARPLAGELVQGEVFWARRRVHMAQHTGQHMLSRALLDVAGAETVSSRLGETACTIDLDKAELAERDLARAEDLVNAVIDDDVRVRAFFPDPGQLAELPLRRDPKVKENIRVVQIGDFDVSPCGGTHCTATSQVGLVRITGVERYKGKQRVTFAAGRRAREELGACFEVLHGLARGFTCGAREVPAAIDKLRRELGEAREALGRARARLAEATAAELLAATPADAPRIVARFDDGDAEYLRVVARRLLARPRTAVLLAAVDGAGLRLFFGAPAEAGFDCGAAMKQVVAAAGGKGGGGKERAEGVIPLESDFLALVGAI